MHFCHACYMNIEVCSQWNEIACLAYVAYGQKGLYGTNEVVHNSIKWTLAQLFSTINEAQMIMLKQFY